MINDRNIKSNMMSYIIRLKRIILSLGLMPQTKAAVWVTLKVMKQHNENLMLRTFCNFNGRIGDLKDVQMFCLILTQWPSMETEFTLGTI